jgi:hypothetical protein
MTTPKERSTTKERLAIKAKEDLQKVENGIAAPNKKVVVQPPRDIMAGKKMDLGPYHKSSDSWTYLVRPYSTIVQLPQLTPGYTFSFNWSDGKDIKAKTLELPYVLDYRSLQITIEKEVAMIIPVRGQKIADVVAKEKEKENEKDYQQMLALPFATTCLVIIQRPRICKEHKSIADCVWHYCSKHN